MPYPQTAFRPNEFTRRAVATSCKPSVLGTRRSTGVHSLRPFPMKIPTTLVIAACFIVVPSGHAQIRFDGVVAYASRTVFALTDTRTGESRWVPIGGRFSGYTVARYDGAANALALQTPGEELILRLQEGSVRPPGDTEEEQDTWLRAREMAEQGNERLRMLFALHDGAEALLGMHTEERLQAQQALAAAPTEENRARVSATEEAVAAAQAEMNATRSRIIETSRQAGPVAPSTAQQAPE